MPAMMEMTAINKVAIRAAITCSRSVPEPLRIAPIYTSWARDDAAASVSPATTATIVAKDTAATTASMKLPIKLSGPPPNSCASMGAARLPPLSRPRMALGPTFSAAEKPITTMNRWHKPMANMAYSADLRAALALGTVKKRIRICGMAAVPSTSAIPRETCSIGFFKYRPGSRKRCPASATPKEDCPRKLMT